MPDRFNDRYVELNIEYYSHKWKTWAIKFEKI